MKKILSLALLLLTLNSYSQFAKQKEVYYQNLFAKAINGTTEVSLPDLSRVDIVTDIFAIEVDFGPKWAESIGQSLYYGLMLNKKPGVLLVVNGGYEYKNVNRLLATAKKYNIMVWTLDYRTNAWKIINK